MTVAERVTYPIQMLRNIALKNAKEVAEQVSIVKEETRKVNGVDVLMLQIEGVIEGLSFIYYGYYYVGKEGSVQVIAYTAKQLFGEYFADFEEALNGFVLLQ